MILIVSTAHGSAGACTRTKVLSARGQDEWDTNIDGKVRLSSGISSDLVPFECSPL